MPHGMWIVHIRCQDLCQNIVRVKLKCYYDENFLFCFQLFNTSNCSIYAILYESRKKWSIYAYTAEEYMSENPDKPVRHYSVRKREAREFHGSGLNFKAAGDKLLMNKFIRQNFGGLTLKKL